LGVDRAALERKIKPAAIVLLDTNVLIAYLEGGQQVTEIATLIVDEWVRNGRNRAIIGMVTAMELLVGPMRAGRGYRDAEDFLLRFPNVETAPLDFRAAFHAAEVRARHGLKPPDSLIIGTGIALGVDVIVTNDGKWDGKSPVSVATLSDYVT
jgi:predicted nucleic acid-binding protein